MTGTPYEGWFTPQERRLYHEVIEGRKPGALGTQGTYRPHMSRLKWLVRTDMSVVEMAREVGASEKCVREAITRMDLHPSAPTPIKGPTYMAHDWFMTRKDRRIWK